jgi:hypothetical protein
VSTGQWVVVCDLPQWVITAKPITAIICEHQQALIGHYLINPTLILHRCDTRREALRYLQVIARTAGVVVAAPPDEAKPISPGNQ